jgi:hypothetical protein
MMPSKQGPIFECFQSLTCGREITEEFRKLGLTTQDEATDFLATHFLDTDSRPTALSITNCLKSCGSQTISSTELSVAAGKILPEVHDRLFNKKETERNRLFREQQAEKNRMFNEQQAEKTLFFMKQQEKNFVNYRQSLR